MKNARLTRVACDRACKVRECVETGRCILWKRSAARGRSAKDQASATARKPRRKPKMIPADEGVIVTVTGFPSESVLE
ncbi:hypothetical protein [Actinobaculum sp. 313]|uniref:hypothetical protein n=1 Tax=Actinobaculum sp. 313 TaxID=2495645 RepID=UPI000D528FB0|nr:hypothetical protein [Actinobaculum sp. 313]AWE42938.1 hypothetical protein DDD63_09525 [Actinobaculum sp. 313]